MKEMLVFVIEVDQQEVVAAEGHLLGVLEHINGNVVLGPEPLQEQYLWLMETVTSSRRKDERGLPRFE